MQNTNPTKNTAEFDFLNLLTIFGEEVLINIESNMKAVGVSTDTRTIETGNIFVALIGENFDAHTKIEDAFKAGASVCIVNTEWYESNHANFTSGSFILVQDTLRALAELGHFHRKRFSIDVIAVAGSNGKTTTKELIAAVLSSKGKVLKTYGNYNNQVGVPLMLLMLDDSYKYAVLEIGTNEPGEITILAKIAAPTQGIITNIGLEHLEKLLDIDGVEMEETSLIAHLIKHRGYAFINADDNRLYKYKALIDKSITYGTDENAMVRADYTFDENLMPLMEIKYEEKTLNIKSAIIGYSGVINSLAAVTIGIHNEVADEDIVSAINNFSPLKSDTYARMSLEKMTKFTILNDCYNANPSSMQMVLKTVSALSNSGRKIAILGEMRELGEESAESHKEILNLALEICDEVYTFGKDFENANFELKTKAKIFTDKQKLIETIVSSVKQDDFLIVKGSRGTKMEEVILELRKLETF